MHFENIHPNASIELNGKNQIKPMKQNLDVWNLIALKMMVIYLSRTHNHSKRTNSTESNKKQ